MYAIENNNKGITQLLEITDKLANKNLNFFRNTFKFFLEQHPPYGSSLLYFDIVKNDYKFVSLSLLQDMQIFKFEDYISGYNHSYIKEHTFYYGINEPHVLISSADFILDMMNNTTRIDKNERIDELAEKFYNWYKVKVQEEIIAIKSLKYPTCWPTPKVQIKQLF